MYKRQKKDNLSYDDIAPYILEDGYQLREWKLKDLMESPDAVSYTHLKPQWAKAVFFFEGIIIGISGYTLLATPYNYLLGIIGLAIVVIAVLALSLIHI